MDENKQYKRIQAAARKYRDREDIAQQAFEIWLRRQASAKARGVECQFHPDTLCVDAMRMLHGDFRRKKRPTTVPISNDYEDTRQPTPEINTAFMPRQLREAFELVYKQRMTQVEASKVLGITPSGVHIRMKKAFRWLNGETFQSNGRPKLKFNIMSEEYRQMQKTKLKLIGAMFYIKGLTAEEIAQYFKTNRNNINQYLCIFRKVVRGQK